MSVAYIDSVADKESVQYGLLANKNSLLFTKLPNSLFMSHTTTPSSSPVDISPLHQTCPCYQDMNQSFDNCTVSTKFSKSNYAFKPHTQTAQDSTLSKSLPQPSQSTNKIPPSKSFSSLKGFTSRTASKASSLFSSLSGSSSTTSLDSLAPAERRKVASKVSPPNLGGKPLCPTQLAILDLVTYFDVVNMCVCAKTSPPIKIEHSDVNYTNSLQQSSLASASCRSSQVPVVPQSISKKQVLAHPYNRKNIRKIRRFIMDKNVSICCFERQFLYKLMLECFENPFEDSNEPLEVVASQSNYTTDLGSHSNASGFSKDISKDDARPEQLAFNVKTQSPFHKSSIENTKMEYNELGDPCLHVELIHPVEHGNLYYMLSNILSRDKCIASA